MFEFSGRFNAASRTCVDTPGMVNNVDRGESIISEFPLHVSGALAARGSLSGSNVEIS